MIRANTDNLLGVFPMGTEAVFRSCNAKQPMAQESPA